MSDLISSGLTDDLKNSWRTDPAVFDAINKEFNFSMDAACSDENTLVPECYLTQKTDALIRCWGTHMMFCDMPNKNVWVNPPYGRGMIKAFMQKAVEQKHLGVTTVMLVPATLDAQWLPISDISEIRIITGGRLSFYHPVTDLKVNGNTKGSMLVVFRPSIMPCVVRLIDRNELISGDS